MHNLLLILILLCGCALRFTGLTRGESDFVPSERRGSDRAFYHFHPDEETLIGTALEPLDLLDPPLTAYGMLPAYALKGIAEALALLFDWGPLSLNTFQGTERIFFTARILAVFFSCATLWLTWLLGRRYFSSPAACLGIAFLAFMPGAVQQAHFYLVDGLFVFLSTATLCLILRALESDRRQLYLGAGMLIGLTASVRLNGALLGLLMAVGYLMRSRRDGKGWRKLYMHLADRRLWLAGGVALLVAVILQPYLIADPLRLWRVESTADFGMSLKIATGDMLQPWTLIDLHTLPYLHHWTHLMPRIAGWPLTLLFIAGLVYGAVKMDWRRGLLLLWCAVYFLQVGGLHTKHVRYLIPLLPLLALFAGAWLASLFAEQAVWKRRLGVAMAGLVLGYTAFYGLAFARIYTIEDSRIQAGRWLARHAVGSKIGIERGGFSLNAVIRATGNEKSFLGLAKIYAASAYMTCSLRREYLLQRMGRFDYIAVADINRYRQFTAVPELFPALSDFYRQLVDGNLGFAPVQRFKNYAQLLGVRFVDDDAEPSFIGYDHPAVLIFKRKEPALAKSEFAAWHQVAKTEKWCADDALHELADHLNANHLEDAVKLARHIQREYPLAKLSYLMEAEIHRRSGAALLEQQARQKFDPYYRESLVRHFVGAANEHEIPGVSALSLVELGLPDLALDVLRRAQNASAYSKLQRRSMAQDFVMVAKSFYKGKWVAHYEEAARLALGIFPDPGIYTMMGQTAYLTDEFAQALEHWKRALQLCDEMGSPDTIKAEIYWQIGTVASHKTGDYEAAVFHLEKALQLDPYRFAPLRKQIDLLKERPEVTGP